MGKQKKDNKGDLYLVETQSTEDYSPRTFIVSKGNLKAFKTRLKTYGFDLDEDVWIEKQGEYVDLSIRSRVEVDGSDLDFPQL